MKRRLRIIATAVMVSLFSMTNVLVACGDDDDDDEKKESIDKSVQVSESELSFAWSKETKEVVVSSQVDFTYESSADWCLCSRTGSVGAYILKIMAMANNGEAERTAEVSLMVDGEVVSTIKVTQACLAVAGEVSSIEVARKMGLGWNLGNQFDAYNNGVADETAWGNKKATQATFDAAKNIGIKTVRIPITWLGKVGAAPTYTIDEAWLDRIAEVVGYAEKAGLNAIINIHHDGADSKHWLNIKSAATSDATNESIKERISAMWCQIAEKFVNTGDFLIFEAFNEIHDGGWGWGNNRNDGGKQYQVLNEWNQVFVDAVRGVGGENVNRWLAVPGYVTNIDLTVENLVLPTDPTEGRLMVAAHFYDPNTYTLNAEFSEWGHTGTNKESWGDETSMVAQLKKLKTKYVDNNIPCYIGEMGNVNRGEDRAEAFRGYYFEYLCKACKDFGLAPIIWDNGSSNVGKEASGMIDHGTGAIIREKYNKGHLETMVNAIENDDESYTLESVYDKAP